MTGVVHGQTVGRNVSADHAAGTDDAIVAGGTEQSRDEFLSALYIRWPQEVVVVEQFFAFLPLADQFDIAVGIIQKTHEAFLFFGRHEF